MGAKISPSGSAVVRAFIAFGFPRGIRERKDLLRNSLFN